MIRNFRTLLVTLHDLVAIALAWIFAYLLRFNFELPPSLIDEILRTLIWVVPLQGVIFWRLGLYRGLWRYASVNDLRQIFLAILLSTACVAMALWMMRLNVLVPRSVLVIGPTILLLMMGGSRFAYRLWKMRGWHNHHAAHTNRVLILGANDMGATLSRELASSGDWRVMGFLDDNALRHGRVINGIKVLGALDSLSQWVERMDIKRVVIAMPSDLPAVRRRAMTICNLAGVTALTMPSFGDLLDGHATISQLRAVELDDLLGRPSVQLDAAGLHELLTDKCVFVTGAGGSIGSELCRQIIEFGPRTLVMFELSELALYKMEQELASKFSEISLVFLIGDVRDAARLEQVFSEYEPAVVFHAAAYKHVPLLEHHNTWQAIRNNVLGTWSVATAAQRHNVKKFILISTDKAVNPTNVMGASKRLAEMVCQGLQQPTGTNFVVVRFGNVLGSTGSVIPKFREQIARGGPVTVTHPDITRYFMSIEEAAQLVLQAGLMGVGGEIFVLDMGDPVKIVDLASDLIRLSGFSMDDILIEFTGLRPGEKLYEELLADNECTLPTPHVKMRIAQARTVDAAWLEDLLHWLNVHATQSDVEVRQTLTNWIPEYRPAIHCGIEASTQ